MKAMGGHQPHVFANVEYFARIDLCDQWVVSDDVQFAAKDWQNRNRIKLTTGPTWLTVPVIAKDRQSLKDTLVASTDMSKLWKTIESAYGRLPYFDSIRWLEALLKNSPEHLVDLSRAMNERVIDMLGITTPVTYASALGVAAPTPSEKIAMQAQTLGCDVYATGAGSVHYLKSAPFKERGIEIRSFKWKCPEYRQVWLKNGFEPNLSIFDLLAAEGPENSLAILRSGISLVESPWGLLDDA